MPPSNAALISSMILGVKHRIILLWCLILHFCCAFSTSAPQKQIPITCISGFLGSGKTTLLQNLLENKQGIKIAVIVNDVASLNVDAKLVSGRNSADGMVQLQNGCACCSLSDELLGSVSELVTLSDIRGEDDAFDHIVVEMSGVADPKGVRAQFQEAIFYNMPIMERVRLDTMITVIDCSVFLKYLRSSKIASRKDTPELFYREDEEIPDGSKHGDWMDDMPPLLLEALLAGDGPSATGLRPQDEGGSVADLLVSQTETADIVLLNKEDLVDDRKDMETISQIVSALNPKATIEKASYGKVPLKSILAVAGGNGVVEAGVVDDHRDAIEAAEQIITQQSESPKHHSHEHSHGNHQIEHTHGHSHDHSHGCSDPTCNDASHSHDHIHAEELCNDPNCNDSSHSHSPTQATTSLDQLGIGSFVYRARKPFHPRRLQIFLQRLPISRGLPENSTDETLLSISEKTQERLNRIVRSKGFIWLADSNLAANYWSHAGASFELQCLGRWWSTLSRQEWPSEAVDTILSDFDNPNHDEHDFSASTVGDRRQEIVFIGPGLGNKNGQQDITVCLDECLLTEAEWEEYKEKKLDEKALRIAFASPFSVKMLSY